MHAQKRKLNGQKLGVAQIKPRFTRGPRRISGECGTQCIWNRALLLSSCWYHVIPLNVLMTIRRVGQCEGNVLSRIVRKPCSACVWNHALHSSSSSYCRPTRIMRYVLVTMSRFDQWVAHVHPKNTHNSLRTWYKAYGIQSTYVRYRCLLKL